MARRQFREVFLGAGPLKHPGKAGFWRGSPTPTVDLQKFAAYGSSQQTPITDQ